VTEPDQSVAEALRRIEAKLDQIAADTGRIRGFRHADLPRWAKLWRRLDDLERIARRGMLR
jgi:hypothetical protein